MRSLLTVLFVTMLTLTATPATAQEGAGSISGAVTADADGAPITDLCVEAYDPATFTVAASTETGGDGTYDMSDVPEGEYFVGFNTCRQDATSGYASEWWRDAQLNDLTPVTITAGEAETGIDAALATAGTIRGTITDADTDEPVAGICVTAFGGEQYPPASAETDADGAYAIGTLLTGDYIIFFIDCSDPFTHEVELYDDVTARTPDREPETVHVEAGEETAGIDAAIAEGGALSGTVTAVHTGRELPFVCVAAVPTGADPNQASSAAITGIGLYESFTFPYGDGAEFDGEYTIGGVPAGTYEVQFNATVCGDDGYRIEWFDDTTDRSAATSLTVNKGEVLDGLDAVLQPLPSIATACFTTGTETGGEPGDRPTRFRDVSSENVHWRAIECAADANVATGDGDGNYRPGAVVRRDQMASFVARSITALGVELPSDPPDAFDDDDGNIHEPAINQLAAADIVSGTGEGRYSPTAAVGRGAMTTFLVNAYEYATGLTLRSSGDHFRDDGGTTHENSVNLAATAGFAAGSTETTFAPDAPVQRDQMASFVMRTIDRALRDVIDLQRAYYLGSAEPSGSASASGSASGSAG